MRKVNVATVAKAFSSSFLLEAPMQTFGDGKLFEMAEIKDDQNYQKRNISI